ncbi:MAG TPA: hypothetical protein VML50_03925 [Anaeromyxobacter sp.]|nr:hypothetical protein [Anaeromyxobacter sp.]
MVLVLLALAALAAPAPPPASPAASEAAALRALAVIAAGEPAVADVQAAAALQADRASPDPGAWPARARLSALLPRLTAEYRHEQQSTRTTGLQSAGEVDYLRLVPSDAMVIRLSWDLGELLAAPGEVGAAVAAAARARRRAEAVSRATALHFERRRLEAALLLDPPQDPVARATAELEIERLRAELDALTGGLLSGRRP